MFHDILERAKLQIAVSEKALYDVTWRNSSNSRPLTLNPSPHRMGRGNLILNTLSSIGWRRG
jgi:hypothetical protein